MPRSSAVFGLLVLLLLPMSASGLGLGEIQLNSALNEPLNAEIELVSLEQSDLNGFEATIATVETFARYGLDRPDYLSGLRFAVGTTPTGKPVLLVRSAAPISEPFVTFLVEANWSRGRLLREYTVLLDPPVFNPDSAAPPVATPQSSTSQVSRQGGFVPRPTPAPRSPTPTPRRSVVAATSGSTYGPVRRNQTLWEIADSARRGSDLTINQMMIAIYRDNPDAFLGNINLLKEGSTLNLPDANRASAAVSRSDALAAAKNHNARWRAGGTVARSATATPAAADDSATRRLRLVAPGDDDNTTGAANDGALNAVRAQLADEQQRNDALNDDIDALREELEESKRLFNLRSTELAEMQARLGAEQTTDDSQSNDVEMPATVDAQPTTPDDATRVADAGDLGGTIDGSGLSDDGVSGDTPGADTSIGSDTTGTTATAPVQPVAAAPAPLPVAEPSFLGKVGGFFANYWLWLLGAMTLIGGLLFALKMTRGQDDDSDTWEALSKSTAQPEANLDMAAAAAGDGVMSTGDTGQVEYFEDTGTFKPIDFSEAESDVDQASAAAVDTGATGATAVDFPFEDTMAGEQELKLDQSDPLAEAEFHIAYGLFDQAAELVSSASEREPERRDLKMKLIEIYFVWGNKDAFLDAATAMHAEMAGEQDANWDSILIMGKQICPDEALFSGEVGGGAAVVDLQLDTTGSVPMDLAQGDDDDLATVDVDLDLGEALDVASASAAAVDNVIDFDFGGDATAASDAGTSELQQRIASVTEDAEDTEEMDLNELGIDLDFGAEDGSDDAVMLDVDDGGDVEVEFDIGEDFDELFAGLDEPAAGAENDPNATDDSDSTQRSLTGDFEADFGATDFNSVVEDEAAGIDADFSSLPDVPDDMQGDKLLDTSELKVEMEELLAAAVADDDDDVDPFAAAQGDKTGSFSSEIRSLKDDGLNIDMNLLDDGGDADDDATIMMEHVDLPDGGDDGDFGEVFGSDDETVLAEALILPNDDSAADANEKNAVIDFGNDDDDVTAMMARFDDAPAGDEFADVFAAGDDQDDDNTFQGVFQDEDAAEGQTGEDTMQTIFAGEDGTQEMTEIEFDVGDALDESSGDNTTVKVSPTDLALPPGDATGSSEIGTKLDLARAYMEMGDPDGARGILQEVIDEGDDTQQKDARALLDALP